ncbi:MAG TPA: hypothetical protein VG165_14560 [Solirubrobacteraceae bacterium]|jgi:hypothetical protein|nr:hypothetical protein [Solirubrobacteraceae bacterium]
MARFLRVGRRRPPSEDESSRERPTPGDATVAFDVTTADHPPEDSAPAAGKGQGATSYRDRARLRRRLRYLRRARELSFRDLGGFVFDAHRFNRSRDDIVAAKLKGLAGMDAELRSLETALDDRRELMLLHEPGISVCPRCATLHGSDANFCAGCGLPRRGAALPLGPRAPLPVAETTGPAAAGTAGTAADQQPTTVIPARPPAITPPARIDLRKPPAAPDGAPRSPETAPAADAAEPSRTPK